MKFHSKELLKLKKLFCIIEDDFIFLRKECIENLFCDGHYFLSGLKALEC